MDRTIKIIVTKSAATRDAHIGRFGMALCFDKKTIPIENEKRLHFSRSESHGIVTLTLSVIVQA